jgi:3'-phosphoadenosine 5'-phosphosulfate sulfotransferase (PAPS reductase)/FAD synthetase
VSAKDGETIVVWFSCGAASAVAAKRTVQLYGQTNPVRVVNNPVKEEHEDNRRFLKDVENWIGMPIELAVNSNYKDASCETVWDKRQYMSGVSGAPCTLELKKRARQQWEEKNKVDWHVLGYTYEEKKRAEMFRLTERENLLAILVSLKLTKIDCFKIVNEAGIKLPEIYKLGYPNANCIGCVKATSPTYWNHVRKVHPEVFARRAAQSRKIGARLVRVGGERIFLDELSPNAKGRPMKQEAIECGIFCEEKT